MQIIIDTSVMVDLVLTTRGRHPYADQLREWLHRRDVRVRMPMHALFELSAALRQEKMTARRATLAFNPNIPIETPLKTDPVPIDEAFFARYFDAALPYLKGGDLIFVAMAKVDGAELITEDQQQLSAAKEAGVRAYRIDEFLAANP